MEENNNFQSEQNKFRSLMPDYNPQFNVFDYRVGIGRRIAAALLDFIILGVITSSLGFAFGLFKEFINIDLTKLMDPVFMEEFQSKFLPLSLVVTFVYYSMEIFFQATLGKMMLGIIITDESMRYASMSQLTTRFVIKHLESFIQVVFMFTSISFLSSLSSLVSFVILVAFLFVLRTSKQSLYDQVSKTAVYFKSEIEANTNNFNKNE
jgi:uncharacterized RDD family membrane protein YckC